MYFAPAKQAKNMTMKAISALINRTCRENNSAVVFVTHEINPVIDYVDRVLYLADGRFRVTAILGEEQ